MAVPVTLDCAGLLQMLNYQYQELSAIRSELGCLNATLASILPSKGERLNRDVQNITALASLTQSITQALCRLGDQTGKTVAPYPDVPSFVALTIEDCPSGEIASCETDTIFCPPGQVNYQDACVPAVFEFVAPGA